MKNQFKKLLLLTVIIVLCLAGFKWIYQQKQQSNTTNYQNRISQIDFAPEGSRANFDKGIFDAFGGQFYFAINDNLINPQFYSISAQLMNLDIDNGFFTDSYLIVQQYTETGWVELTLNNKENSSEEPFYITPGMSGGNFRVEPRTLNAELESGLYRFVTVVWSDNDRQEETALCAWAEFTVDPNVDRQIAFMLAPQIPGLVHGKHMTISDLVELARLGSEMKYSDLLQYKWYNISPDSFTFYMGFPISGGYRLLVHADTDRFYDAYGNPMIADREMFIANMSLERIRDKAWDGIDIRTEDVSLYLMTYPSSETEQAEDQPYYTDFTKLPVNYSLQRAKDDNCVVIEDSEMTSGHEVWSVFLDNVTGGKDCMVRIAHYYTLSEQGVSAEYYQANKDNYPYMHICDVYFTQGFFLRYDYSDSTSPQISTWLYLLFLDDIPSNAQARYTGALHFTLANDDSLTWSQINASQYSSLWGATLPYSNLYTMYDWK